MRRNVPKGLNDRSQAIYCLGVRKRRSRPVGHGVIRGLWAYRLGATEKNLGRESYRTLWDGTLLLPNPGRQITWLRSLVSLRDSHGFVTNRRP